MYHHRLLGLLTDRCNGPGTYGNQSGGRTRYRITILLGIGAKVWLILSRLLFGRSLLMFALFKVCVCSGSPTTRGPLGEEPTYLPTGTKYAVVPGMPTGALANGENTVHRRGYFLGMVYAQVPTLFAFLYLHWCRGFD